VDIELLNILNIVKTRNQYFPPIKGVVLSESAVDWVRQWFEGQKQVRDHLTEGDFLKVI
jgi:hypothetical protein